MKAGKKCKGYMPYLLAIMSGVLAALSLPGYDLDFLVWFSPLPLFWALRGKSYKQSFGLSFLAGIFFFALLYNWIPILRIWAGPIVFLGYLILILFSALFWGVFGLAYSIFKDRLRPVQLAIITPSIWVILEYLRTVGQFGSTWGDLGYSLYKRPILIQMASFAGVWGISFLIVLISYLLFLSLKDRKIGYFLSCIVILLVVGGWGYFYSLDQNINGQKLQVGLVQPNVEQAIKRRSQNTEKLVEKYRQALEELSNNDLDLVVFPESVFPFLLLDRKEVLDIFTDFAKSQQLFMLLGTATREANKFYNAAILISPQGEVIDKYSKVKLVPFGEYLPFRELIKSLGLPTDQITPLLGDLTPGDGFRPLRSRLGSLATPICFESAFAGPVRKFVDRGAELIITITNDAWFLDSIALPQHFAKGVFRAVENRRFFVQAANTGISGIISPGGRIVKRGLAQEEGVIRGEVALGDESTVYNLLGDWFVLLAVLILVAHLIFLTYVGWNSGK